MEEKELSNVPQNEIEVNQNESTNENVKTAVSKGKSIFRFCFCTVIILATLFLLQRLLMPKYMSDIVEGAMIAEYYEEDHDFDVVFIGDCEVYENFSPQVLWDEYGINSFIRGSAQQLIWQSYYLMEDTLRFEKPDVFVFNILSMKYNVPQSEAYNRMSIDGMKWSGAKIHNVSASMTEEEEFADYLFPILRYHSRWSELSKEDVKYMFHADPVTFNGYYMRCDVLGVDPESVPKGKPLGDYNFGSNSYEYLDKMVELCEKNGVQLVFVKAPSLYPYWYDQWEEQIEQYAQAHDILYINYLELIDELGIDFSTDTYDAGLHMNLYGAEKLSRHIGQVLSANCGVPDRRKEAELSKVWDKKREAYEAEIASQLRSIELTGKVEK